MKRDSLLSQKPTHLYRETYCKEVSALSFKTMEFIELNCLCTHIKKIN